VYDFILNKKIKIKPPRLYFIGLFFRSYFSVQAPAQNAFIHNFIKSEFRNSFTSYARIGGRLGGELEIH